LSKKLNQIATVHKDVKERAHRELTNLHRIGPDLYTGLSRTYTPLNDEDPDRPDNTHKSVQLTASHVLARLTEVVSGFWDAEATLARSNQDARADLVVDGLTILRDVPGTVFLFLEKQLADIRTFLTKLPVLDSTETWVYDDVKGYHRTEPVDTQRTRKVNKVLTAAPATDKHPAQVHIYQDDVPVGTWSVTKFSGALTPARKTELLTRVNKLYDAVKQAREAANLTEVTELRIAQPLLGWLLGDE
jgi:hypothetical protein